MPNWSVFVVSKRDTDELNGSATPTLQPLDESFTMELQRYSFLSHPSLDQSGFPPEQLNSGTNFLEKYMTKPWPEPSESGMMSDMEELDFDTWLTVGIEQGWIGPPVCETHDGLPMSDEEWAITDLDGEPPCIHILRLYPDSETKEAVEKAHSPSVWRRKNMGL